MAAGSQRARAGENGTPMMSGTALITPGTDGCGPVSSFGTRDSLMVNVRKPP